jgi:hypothetical protein
MIKNMNKKTYSQIGQDLFVLSLFPQGYKGFFMDIGCQLPENINNTLLLEENGWNGISFDIEDYSKEWGYRKTPFILADAFKCDFNQYNIPAIVDYLSLDINLCEGSRFAMIKRLLNEFSFEYKVITIEHDSYRGYEFTERNPQRIFLIEKGYLPARANVKNKYPFEDWWINPKYFNIKINARI